MESLERLIAIVDKCIDSLEHCYYETVERFPKTAEMILNALNALRDARFTLLLKWLRNERGETICR